MTWERFTFWAMVTGAIAIGFCLAFGISGCGPVTLVDRRAIINGDYNTVEYRADAETRVDRNVNAPPTTNDVTVPVIP